MNLKVANWHWIDPTERRRAEYRIKNRRTDPFRYKDSAKIAVFLRYSVSTIYNYRSQIKTKQRASWIRG
jgi:DNA-binding CsgD family transcriptional regulator